MTFPPISVSIVCEGVKLAKIGENQNFKSKFQILIPLIDFIAAQTLSFSSKLPRFSKKISIQANLAENLNSPVFEMIFGFCSSLPVDDNSTLKILIIHENFSLGPILGLEVTIGTLSLGAKKLKFSKCFVSNQISGEGYL